MCNTVNVEMLFCFENTMPFWVLPDGPEMRNGVVLYHFKIPELLQMIAGGTSVSPVLVMSTFRLALNSV